MIELGVEWQKSLTLHELDIEFEDRKRRVLEANEAGNMIKPPIEDPARAPLGAILTEAISAAFWSDATMVCLSHPRSQVQLTSRKVLSSGKHDVASTYDPRKHLSSDGVGFLLLCPNRCYPEVRHPLCSTMSRDRSQDT